MGGAGWEGYSGYENAHVRNLTGRQPGWIKASRL